MLVGGGQGAGRVRGLGSGSIPRAALCSETNTTGQVTFCMNREFQYWTLRNSSYHVFLVKIASGLLADTSLENKLIVKRNA